MEQTLTPALEHGLLLKQISDQQLEISETLVNILTLMSQPSPSILHDVEQQIAPLVLQAKFTREEVRTITETED